MHILVAGGAGFIGSHLCARLLEDGHDVLCVDNYLTGARRNVAALEAHPRFHLLEHDVSLPLPSTFAVDAAFHLASPASPVGYWTYPFETIQVNTQGTRNLLEVVRRTGGRFLMASTSEAYGDPLEHPQRETYFGNVNPTGPRACYDESKRLGETLTMEYHRRYGTDTRIVRIFNTYGPHSQLNDGRFIPNFAVQAIRGEPLTVHGAGTQTRSICYVTDLVDGLVRTLFTPDTTGEIFNLGNPEEHTILEWAEMIRRLTDSSAPITFAEAREEDPSRRCPDISKARARLGWSPQVSPEEGLTRSIAWFRQELERQEIPSATKQPLPSGTTDRATSRTALSTPAHGTSHATWRTR